MKKISTKELYLKQFDDCLVQCSLSDEYTYDITLLVSNKKNLIVNVLTQEFDFPGFYEEREELIREIKRERVLIKKLLVKDRIIKEGDKVEVIKDIIAEKNKISEYNGSFYSPERKEKSKKNNSFKLKKMPRIVKILIGLALFRVLWSIDINKIIDALIK